MDSTGRAPRIAVLWTQVTGYVQAELQALADHGAELLLVRRENAADTPFDTSALSACVRTVTWSEEPNYAEILGELKRFAPDAVVVVSWNRRAYRRIAKAIQGESLRILAMDNQWLGTIRQRAAVWLSPFLIRPLYDAVFLPADPQAAFAQRLGFSKEQMIWGLNTCDYPRFSEVAKERDGELTASAFLFVGRLVPEKGVDILQAAYVRYRRLVADPWPLHIVGVGGESARFSDIDGVRHFGFVQPKHMPDVYRGSGCLVVPSRFEPWAIVIHEAVTAGLPVICTQVCGAASRLVLDGYNGVVIPPGDAGSLTRALLRIHRSTDDERRAMQLGSEQLAAQFTPDRWARALLTRLPDLRSQAGLAEGAH